MLSKAESRERWHQIRALWNDWDPIGVASDALDNEYESYLGPALRLLESRASLDELERYLAQVIDRMGLTETKDAQTVRREFAMRLREWYESKWPGSHA